MIHTALLVLNQRSGSTILLQRLGDCQNSSRMIADYFSLHLREVALVEITGLRVGQVT
jgi:hypothetical protein